MTVKSKNTQIRYTYRDAANYKTTNQVVLEGELSGEQINSILSLCDNSDGDGPFFIPSQVGLRDLQGDLVGDYDDDHIWHILNNDSFSVTSAQPTETMTAAVFYGKFKAVAGEWDEERATLAMHELKGRE